MTYIDFFVAAYFLKKGNSHNQALRIVNKCGKKYKTARKEYVSMKGLYEVNDLKEWIRANLRTSSLLLNSYNEIYNK